MLKNLHADIKFYTFHNYISRWQMGNLKISMDFQISHFNQVPITNIVKHICVIVPKIRYSVGYLLALRDCYSSREIHQVT